MRPGPDPTRAERLGRPHWVYRCFDSEGQLLYVGLTHNPKGRLIAWRSAARTQPRHAWFSEVVRMDWQRYPGYWTAETTERAAIVAERPRHNRQHNPTGRMLGVILDFATERAS